MGVWITLALIAIIIYAFLGFDEYNGWY